MQTSKSYNNDFESVYNYYNRKVFSSYSGNNSDKALKIIGKLQNDGYSICTDQIVDLKQGESGIHAKYFEGGIEYIIVGFSDDTNVLDIGLCLERMNGASVDYNTTRGEIAMIFFKSKITQKMKVVATSFLSRTPDTASKYRIIIGYKDKE